MLASNANGLEELCTGFLLHNMAVVMSASGRLGEAESFAERSVKVLEKSYPPEDLALLRPLASLSSALLDQRKIRKARAVFQRMLSVRTERPADRAQVHGLEGALLYAEAGTMKLRPSFSKLLPPGRNRGVAKLSRWRRSSVV